MALLCSRTRWWTYFSMLSHQIHISDQVFKVNSLICQTTRWKYCLRKHSPWVVIWKHCWAGKEVIFKLAGQTKQAIFPPWSLFSYLSESRVMWSSLHCLFFIRKKLFSYLAIFSNTFINSLRIACILEICSSPPSFPHVPFHPFSSSFEITYLLLSSFPIEPI